MSQTPLTDAQAYDVGGAFHKDGAVVAAGFARHLEETREDVRRELGIAQSRLASIFLSGALDDKLCGDIQKWAKDYTAEMTGLRAKLTAERTECLEQARLNGIGAEREAALLSKIEMMKRALEEIASYDRDSKHGEGICPYGCDTPCIARTALSKAGRIA